MESRKIRVLAIAPYKAMARQLTAIVSEFTNIDLTVHVGDRNEGIQLAQANYHSNYDVLLSRGGTATLLQKSVSLPVIEIETSAYDVLASLKLANIEGKRIAIIGYPNVINAAKMLCSLMRYDFDVFTIHSDEDIDSVSQKIIKEKYYSIFGDVAGYNAFRKFGIRSYLITSGDESIRQSFRNITLFKQMNLQLTSDNNFLRSLLQNKVTNTVVFTKEWRLIYSNNNYNQQEILSIIQEKMKDLSFSSDMKLHFQLHNNLYNIYTRTVRDENNTYIAFDYTVNHIMPSSQNGIHYYNINELTESYNNSIYSIVGVSSSLLESVQQFNALSNPIFISGEQGTGKEQFSMFLYMKGPYTNHPFIQINANMLDEKSWHFLTEHHLSPLYGADNTIFISDIDSLSEEKQSKLLSYLLSAQVYERNHLIISFHEFEYHQISKVAMEYKNKLHCNAFSLEPLRNDSEKIRNSALLYLNWLNANGERSLNGFDDEALALLSAFSWPQNYFQFQRVMTTIYASAKGSVINGDDVKIALDNESKVINVHSGKPNDLMLDLSSPLSTINHEIVKYVLKKNNGNQTHAAQSLNISRTTLWKMLKE